jgi:hypothetical protein
VSELLDFKLREMSSAKPIIFKRTMPTLSSYLLKKALSGFRWRRRGGGGAVAAARWRRRGCGDGGGSLNGDMPSQA